MSRRAQIAFLSRVARAYDPVVRFMGFEPLWRVIAEVAAPVPNEHALDVCTGTGGAAMELARRGARVVALDLAHGMLRQAHRKRGVLGNGVKPLFVRMDARQLAFPNRFFPLVTCAMALHEMAEAERAQVLSEIFRVAHDRVVVAEYRVPRLQGPGLRFRLKRLYEYVESDDFEGFVRHDVASRLAGAGFTVGSPRDVGAYRVWPCRVNRP
jgi:ubiquinone/menaquinone biosynthesis C-methylase UbiE